MKVKLGGLYILMCTPFKNNFKLDLEGVRENVRFLLDNGINGNSAILVPGAGYGEGVYMSLEEHARLVETILDEVQGEIPVFPGVHLNGTLEAMKYCKKLQDLGATGVQLAPPAAYSTPTDEDIFYHYKKVAEAAPNLGIIIYNTHWEWGMPPHRDMTPTLIEKLLSIKNVVGVKWSSKTLSNYIEVLKKYSKKGIFYNNMGPEVTPLHYMLGGKGFCTNEVAPRHILKLKTLLEERKYAEAWDEMTKWEFPQKQLQEEIAKEGKHWVAFAKALVEACGLHAGPPRPPQKPLTEKQKEKVKKLVAETEIL